MASITLQDDTVATPEGIAIGSELADVTAAYGDSSSDTKCEYVKGDSQDVYKRQEDDLDDSSDSEEE